MISDKVDPGAIDQLGSGAVAIQDSVAAGPGGVTVKGNVEGDQVALMGDSPTRWKTKNKD